MSGDTDRTRHICPDAQSGAAKCKKCGFATCRPTGGVLRRVRVSGSPPDIGERFKGEKSDRNVGFDKWISTSIAQEPDNRSVLLKRDQPGGTRISDGRRKTGDAHGVFHADGHSGEKTCPVALPRRGLCLGYHHLSQTVCFPMGV